MSNSSDDGDEKTISFRRNVVANKTKEIATLEQETLRRTQVAPATASQVHGPSSAPAYFNELPDDYDDPAFEAQRREQWRARDAKRRAIFESELKARLEHQSFVA